MKIPLREIGRVDHQPQEYIKSGMEGLIFDYYYSGKRMGSNGQIELSVTGIITDSAKITNKRCRKLYSVGGYFLHRKALMGACMKVKPKARGGDKLRRFTGLTLTRKRIMNSYTKSILKGTILRKPTKKYCKLKERLIKQKYLRERT